MSAPLSKQLFHGTTETLKVGDIVKPSDAAMGTGAYATTHELSAHIYASSDQRLSRKGHLFGMVYKVAPLENDETLTNKDTITKQTYRSQKGFRVTGLHDFSVPRNDVG
jgi:hypothetical protein